MNVCFHIYGRIIYLFMSSVLYNLMSFTLWNVKLVVITSFLYGLFNYAQCVIGDDWEHEEIFTDDDEAVGNDPEEREDLAPEVPAPPEIKQVFLFLKCEESCSYGANISRLLVMSISLWPSRFPYPSNQIC